MDRRSVESPPAESTECTRVPVTGMARSLDFYLGLGCEVRRAADGWVELTWGRTRFVLVVSARFPSDAGAAPDQRVVRLAASDVPALRRRLLARGITWRTHRSPWSAHDDIEVADPDGQRIVIHRQRLTSS